jgi:hypothetical protein
MGLGFSNLAMPGVPDFLALPSAFPLMLTPYWWFPSPPESALYLVLALAMGLGAWMAFLWLERMLPRPQAFLIALAFAANPLFVRLASSVMTESPCILLLYAGLWSSLKDAEEGGNGWKGWLALLCWLILFRLRINTMPFLIVHLAVLARRKRFAPLAAGIALAALWLLLEKTQTPPDSGGYLQYDLGRRFPLHADTLETLVGLAKLYAANLYAFAGSAFGNLVLPWFYSLHPMNSVKRLAMLGLSAWALWGLVLFWKDFPRARPYLAAFLLSWMPVFLQGTWNLVRYMLPAFPLWAACLLLPLRGLERRWGARAGAGAALALLIVVAANQGIRTLLSPRLDGLASERESYRTMHAHIRTADPRPDLVLTINHFYTHLETGLPAVWYPAQWPYARDHGMLADKRRMWAFLRLDSPESARRVDLGGGFRLADVPLASDGSFHLYEIVASPRGEGAPPEH